MEVRIDKLEDGYLVTARTETLLTRSAHQDEGTMLRHVIRALGLADRYDYIEIKVTKPSDEFMHRPEQTRTL